MHYLKDTLERREKNCSYILSIISEENQTVPQYVVESPDLFANLEPLQMKLNGNVLPLNSSMLSHTPHANHSHLSSEGDSSCTSKYSYMLSLNDFNDNIHSSNIFNQRVFSSLFLSDLAKIFNSMHLILLFPL